MTHDLLAIEALVRVCHEQFADEVLCLRRDSLPSCRVKVVLTSLDLFKESEVVFIEEGRVARKENEEDDANAPKVTRLLVGALLEDLWRNVARSAASRRRKLLIVDETSQAEVRHLNDGLVKVSRGEK